MKIIVTGGAGFIGSNLVRQLVVEHGHTVLNVDALTYAGNRHSLADLDGNPRHRFAQADICDDGAIRQLFADFQPDWVMHLAAESHVDRSIDGPAEFIQTNIVGTYTLLEAARHYWNGLDGERKADFRFHHISTDEVFGSIDFGSTAQFSETTPYDPSSPYSSSKASSDHFVRSFGKTYGLPVTISNCSNNYGPYQHPEKMVPRMITNLLDGKKVPVYGKGENFRDWLYVDDHCSAIEAIIEKGKLGETYCIGGLKETSRNIDLVHKVLNLMGKPETELEFVTDRPAHDNYAVSWDKISHELGWAPKETLESGLKKTLDWYTAHEPWWRAAKAEAEAFYIKLNNYQNLK